MVTEPHHEYICGAASDTQLNQYLWTCSGGSLTKGHSIMKQRHKKHEWYMYAALHACSMFRANLTCWVDSDFGSDPHTRKSMTGFSVLRAPRNE